MPSKNVGKVLKKTELKDAPVAKEAASGKATIEVVKKDVVPPPVVPAEASGPLISFERWFKSRRYKPHWIAGMRAYASTSGRKTSEGWDQLFKNY